MIYLDNNATTMVPREVLRAAEPFYLEYYGNPHSAHTLGRAAHDGLERARYNVASLLHTDANEVHFTSCGTESNALVLRGFSPLTERKKIVATSVEHPSVLSLLRTMEQRGEIELAIVGVDDQGRVRMDEAERLIDDKTAVVSVMLAQNEVGTIEPVSEIASLAHARGAYLLVDAVQAVGKIEIDLRTLGADFLSLSGHKLHAPKGIGALWIRKGLKLQPLWMGGRQEFGLRSGTEAVGAAVALGEASRLAMEALPKMSEVVALRDWFEKEITGACSFASINGAKATRLPNTANISFRGVFGDEMVRGLDAVGICASAGAACDSGKREPTAVMQALGKPLDEALGAVRFSLSRFTTREEIDWAAGEVIRIAHRLAEQHVTVES